MILLLAALIALVALTCPVRLAFTASVFACFHACWSVHPVSVPLRLTTLVGVANLAGRVTAMMVHAGIKICFCTGQLVLCSLLQGLWSLWDIG